MSRQRRLKIASLVLVLAVAGGACGGKSNDATNASSKKKNDKQETAAAPAAGAEAGADAAAGGTAATKAATGAKAPAASTDGKSSTAASSTNEPIDPKKAAEEAGLDISKFEGDWVAGSPKGMSTDDPRPAGCDFSPGQICRFEVTGRYQLKTAEVATIEVGAYDDGEKTPSFSTKLPGAKKGASQWFVREFPYTARAGVKEMSIVVRMLGADGKEIARGEPTVFPIEKLRSR